MPTSDGTPVLLAAFDKFRGTIGARAACDAAAEAAHTAGIEAEVCPLADGGEGTLEAVGGTPVFTRVTGPAGTPVDAEWRLLDSTDGPRTAVIEMARASGLALAGGAEQNDPIAATTFGVGELIAAAIDHGCGRVVIGLGGSATTDGGAGMLEAIGPAAISGIEILGACDVETLFVDAARVFGPQKGASPEDIAFLTDRLDALGATYLERYGVEVRTIPRSGAAGGLGGGIAALGGHLVSGFDLLARIVGFPTALRRADIVVTGEGRLDATSIEGKVVGEVVARAHGRVPVLVIAGDAEAGVLAGRDDCTVVSLTARFGRDAAMAKTGTLITSVTRAELLTAGW